MKRSQAEPGQIGNFLIAILAFFSAWSFWDSLLYLEGRFYDLLIPGLYGLVAVTAAIALFITALSARHTTRVRWLLFFAGAAILGMPFVFYQLRSPVFVGITGVVCWAICVMIIAGLFYTATSQAVNRTQRIGIYASAISALLAPFMPWVQWVFSLEINLKIGNVIANWSYWYWIYGTWIVIGILGWTAMQMAGKSDRANYQTANQMLIVRGLIIGLCFFFIGIQNPVALSSETYLTETYLGGNLVDTGIETLPTSMNLPLMIGAFLVCLSLALKAVLRPTIRR